MLPGPSPVPHLQQVHFTPRTGSASPLSRRAGLVDLSAAHLAVGPNTLTSVSPQAVLTA